MSTRQPCAAFLIIGLAMPPMAVLGADFVVDTTMDSLDASAGDGTCADAAGRCSLRAAIQESNASAGADTIMLGEGTHAFTLAGSREDAAASGDLDIGGNLMISGAGTGLTRVDAASLDRVFDLHPAEPPIEVALHRMTLQRGAATVNLGVDTSNSAGIRVGAGVQLHLGDIVIRDNRMTTFSGGAAIDTIGGCIHGERVRILDNGDPATPGSARPLSGGIAVRGDGACLHLLDSEISRNRGDKSGAVYSSGNTVISIRRSLIADNFARFSGAIEISSADTVRLENVTISGNRGNPGAILNDGGAWLELTHCTLTRNGPAQSSAITGAILDVHGGFGRTLLGNTIIAGNGPGFVADDCDRAISVGGGNLIGDAARCHFSALPGDQLGVDPGLGELADNGGYTRTHLAGVAVIDRGIATPCPDADQRGVPRPADGDGDGIVTCDSGAVEMADDALFANGFE